MVGKILRFDEVRGYGFIVPEEGSEDVFMHANDLLDEKYLYQAGREVEFFMEMGDKGPKASQIRLIHPVDGAPPAAGRAPVQAPRHDPPRHEAPRHDGPRHDGDADGDTCDILSRAEFRAELTETLIGADGSLTADQLRKIREHVITLAAGHGWVDG
ncbi:cold-shock protein [Streptomyces sp. SM12]|uniref:cold-shock protein n=1 Tax=Streptomyces TaxID=1883 RepID=UPI0035B5AE06